MSLNEKDDDDQNNANSKHDAVTQTEEFDYIYAMKNMTIRPFDESYFAEDDAKVRFYTELPSFDILKTTFNFVAPHVKRNSLNLSKFHEFIMTLIKVRLNVPHQDLAYRFDVSLTTVSRIFNSLVDGYRHPSVLFNFLARERRSLENDATMLPVFIWRKGDCNYRLF